MTEPPPRFYRRKSFLYGASFGIVIASAGIAILSRGFQNKFVDKLIVESRNKIYGPKAPNQIISTNNFNSAPGKPDNIGIKSYTYASWPLLGAPPDRASIYYEPGSKEPDKLLWIFKLDERPYTHYELAQSGAGMDVEIAGKKFHAVTLLHRYQPGGILIDARLTFRQRGSRLGLDIDNVKEPWTPQSLNLRDQIIRQLPDTEKDATQSEFLRPLAVFDSKPTYYTLSITGPGWIIFTQKLEPGFSSPTLITDSYLTLTQKNAINDERVKTIFDFLGNQRSRAATEKMLKGLDIEIANPPPGPHQLKPGGP